MYGYAIYGRGQWSGRFFNRGTKISFDRDTARKRAIREAVKLYRDEPNQKNPSSNPVFIVAEVVVVVGKTIQFIEPNLHNLMLRFNDIYKVLDEDVKEWYTEENGRGATVYTHGANLVPVTTS